MDKRNQHNDLGSSHSKPPSSALPPIWNNISGALDAVDNKGQDEQNTTSIAAIAHQQEVADLTVIKAGFVAMFGTQEPPKFLWDTIEQDLEAHIETDAPVEFSSIKESFLVAFEEQQPPQSLWAELAERVDKPEVEVQRVEKANYSRIKNSFECKYSTVVVPLFSWKDLVKRMDAEAILADTPERFSCIKESFEATYADKAPSIAVANGLWKRLYPLAPFCLLTQQVARSSWLRRSVVGLLVVGLSIGFTMFPVADFGEATKHIHYSTKNTATDAISYIENKTATPSLQEKTRATWNKDNVQKIIPFKKSSFKKELNFIVNKILGNNTIPTILKQRKLTLTKENASNSSVASVERIPTTTTGAIINSTVDNSLPNAEQQPFNIQPSSNQKDNFEYLNHSKNWTKEGVPMQIGVLDLLTLPAVNISLVEEERGNLSNNYIPNSTIARMEEGSFREVHPVIRGKKMHFEFGVEGRLGTSVMLEQKGIKQENREIVLCPTGALGVNFQYYFGLNDALVVGISPYSTAIECWGKHSLINNTHKKTTMCLSFIDFSLGYQRIMFRYRSFMETPSSIYARINLGMGWLAKSDTKVDQYAIHTPKLYRNFNWNVGLAIGNIHQMQRFVLDYGLMGNVGLNCFITGTQPDILQPARIVNVGAYVGLRYLFMPRKAPSKKQRQFDWSAPFYIEEPMF